MSRRKLGSRPQHLSAIEETPAGESVVTSPAVTSEGAPPPPPMGGRDLLTCGQCCQAFPLANILAFIQHKQGGCPPRGPAHSADTPPSPAGRVRQSARSGGPPAGAGFIELRRGLVSGGAGLHGVLKAEPNKTDPEEPSFFSCQQCGGVLPSAWALLQHAQHTHSLSLYQEGEEGEEEQGGGGGGHALQRHQTATLDPRQLSQALASAFQPSGRRPPRPRPASGPPQALNFSVRLRELAEVNTTTTSAVAGAAMGGRGPSPSSPPPAAYPYPQAPGAPRGLLACELCGQVYQSVRGLSAHRRTHGCERPYHCGVCEEAFAQSGQLARHMRSHRGGGSGPGYGRGGAEADEDGGTLAAMATTTRGRLPAPALQPRPSEGELGGGRGAGGGRGGGPADPPLRQPLGGLPGERRDGRQRRERYRQRQLHAQTAGAGRAGAGGRGVGGRAGRGGGGGGAGPGVGLQHGLGGGGGVAAREREEERRRGRRGRRHGQHPRRRRRRPRDGRERPERRRRRSGGEEEEGRGVRVLRQAVPQQQQPDGAPAQPHGRAAVPLRPVQLRLRPELQADAPHEDARRPRRARALPVPAVQRAVHRVRHAGEAPEEGPRAEPRQRGGLRPGQRPRRSGPRGAGGPRPHGGAGSREDGGGGGGAGGGGGGGGGRCGGDGG
uniref:Zinc finger protein 296 n=1 Tax=Gadus morhua TaxID=8049 RepID=A0A8C5B0X0_GADMO